MILFLLSQILLAWGWFAFDRWIDRSLEASTRKVNGEWNITAGS